MDAALESEVAQPLYPANVWKLGCDVLHLRQALEACWDQDTSYQGAVQEGNPALGQCYPTSRVVQSFLPDHDIAKGIVWTGESLESHFWNVRTENEVAYHIDLTWQQFPRGSRVTSFRLLDRNCLHDSEETVERCTRLEKRVLAYLGLRPHACTP